MEPVYSVNLYRNADDTGYVGCWHVPCPDDDPIVARLEAAGIGRGRDEDGTIRRSFFFADELFAQMVAAETETECFATSCLLERTADELAAPRAV